MEVNGQYRNALNGLKKKNIEYVLIKFPYLIKKSFSDLDVLVSDKNYPEVINIPKQKGFILYRSERYYEKFKTVMIKFVPNCGFVKIHLHRRVAWDGKIVLRPENVIQNKIRISDILFVPKKEDTLLITVGHLIFENFKLEKYDFQLIKKLLKMNLDWDYINEQADNFNWMPEFKAFISRVKRMSSFRKLSLKKRFSFGFRWLARVLNVRRKGGLICLLGVDGAGKTSTAKEVANIMRPIEKKSYPIYIGWKPFLPTSKLMHFIGNRIRKKEKKAFKEYRKPEKCGFLDEIIFLHFFLEHFFRYAFEIYPKLRRTHCLIADRYFYDVFAQDPRAGQSRILKFLLKIFPQPDMIFLLDNTPEVIFRRKREFTVPELRRQQRQYSKLRAFIPIKVVKTSVPVAKVADKIVKCSWEKIVNKMAW